MYTSFAFFQPQVPSAVGFVSASGGTITYDGVYKIHTFTSVGAAQDFIVINGGQVEYLVVGGGGGGGGNTGGGGGGGEVLSGFTTVTTAVTYSMEVGYGGAAGAGTGNGGNASSSFAFKSSGIQVQADGGLGGGGRSGAPSAGGASGAGFAGGSFTDPGSGGGGGGDTQVGGDGGAGAGTSTGGAGGSGSYSDITVSGSNVGYGGGGGGGGYNTPGAGATLFGGGNGGTGFTSAGSAGTTNRGGGGGGGGAGNYAGGAGGSGVVIIRYQFYDPTGWTPEDATSATLTMWVESDSGLTESGGYVTAWLDKSSANNDITGSNGGVQYTSSLASINNQPALGFKYNDTRYMSYTNALVPNFASGLHIFIVGSQEYDGRMVSSYYPAFVSEGNTSQQILGLVGKKFPETYIAPATDNYAAGGVYNNGTITYTSGTPYTWEWQFDDFSTLEDAGEINVTTLIKMNGSSIGTLSAWGNPATGKSTTNKWLGNFKDTSAGGGGSMLEGFIAAIVAYNAPLSAEDAAKVRYYLQDKYGHY